MVVSINMMVWRLKIVAPNQHCEFHADSNVVLFDLMVVQVVAAAKLPTLQSFLFSLRKGNVRKKNMYTIRYKPDEKSKKKPFVVFSVTKEEEKTEGKKRNILKQCNLSIITGKNNNINGSRDKPF